DRVERDFGRAWPEQLSWAGEDSKERYQRSEFLPMRFAAFGQQVRGSYLPLYRSEEHLVASGTRSLDIEDWRRPDFLLQSTWPGDAGCGEYDRKRFLQRSFSRIADGICGRSAETARREPRGERRLKTARAALEQLEGNKAKPEIITASQRSGED